MAFKRIDNHALFWRVMVAEPNEAIYRSLRC
jgi:hypothetical protein